MPTAVLPAVGAQPVESRAEQPVQQPWDTAEQQAFRAEITAAWAGRPSAAPGTASPTGTDGLLPTGEPGFAAPVQGFLTPEAAFPLASPGPEYLVPELGLSTPPSGYPIPELDLPAADSGRAATGVTTPVPPVPGHPAAELGFSTPSSGYSSSELDFGTSSPGYRSSELDFGAPQSGYPVSELPLSVPSSGFAASALTPPGPMPGHQAPVADVLTAGGAGYPASPGPTAPAAPLPPAAPPAAAPIDVTVSATGTAYLGKADKALAFARAQVGRPCLWGATGPESYDCSSLTQAAWRAAGVTLPRSAIDQAKAFTRISLAELRPGDLVFFFDDLSHTGLCTGDGMMIHAPGPGMFIREEAILPFGEGALRGAVRPS
ncbi:hypothetical protein B6E66_30285 [Streptomyces maremycinicus]|nr:hypothetical protein B6E66_30285 [Streptomyces sp. B9173]